MPKFTTSLLDEIRRAVPVSTVVGRRFKLKRGGAAGEFQALEDQSLTVNDKKGLWYDFGKHQEGGDIFKWMVEKDGLSFNQAVEECAKIGGIPLPRPSPAKTNGSTAARSKAAPPPREAAPAGRREIVETFDYHNSDEVMIYQTVRFEWIEKGRTRKSFAQRRPSPDERDIWIWGLDAGTFMRKGPGHNWTKFDEDDFEQRGWTEQREFEDGVAHTLYHLPDVLTEVSLGEDGATIFIPEGERKADLLRKWGLVATCNSGGAGYWTQYHAEFLRGADVVIMPDHDDAGRKGALKRARSLRGVARRVRVLSIGDWWPACPAKGDVVDWAKAGGNAEQLYGFLDKIADWKPVFSDSKFGRIKWVDRNTKTTPYRWTVKGLIPAGETVFIWGRTNSGKSFWTYDLSMHVAEGRPYRGRVVMQGLVIYCAMEAGRGFPLRMQAFAKRNPALASRDDVPFELLTKKVDLFSGEIDTDALIVEIEAIAEEWNMPVSVVVIDTYQAATPGMKEIASEDVSRTNQRLDRIRERFSCGLWVVHHPNKQGNEPSGHQSIINGIETSVEIRKKLTGGFKGEEVKDAAGRVIREVVTHKQREGDLARPWEFTLPAVTIGYDTEGDEITSCVVEHEPARLDESAQATRSRGNAPALYGFKLNDGESAFMRALLAALAEHGGPPARFDKTIPGIDAVVDYAHVREAFWRLNVQEDEDKEKARNRVKAALRRARTYLTGAEVLAADNPYIWPTGKRVLFKDGKQWPPAAADAAPVDDADDDDQPKFTEADFGL